MKIQRHPSFNKSYKQRVANNLKLVTKVRTRLKSFQQNPKNPLLKDHALVGKKIDLRAFSITGDIRIVYFPQSADEVLLLDIGTHNQVY